MLDLTDLALDNLKTPLIFMQGPSQLLLLILKSNALCSVPIKQLVVQFLLNSLKQRPGLTVIRLVLHTPVEVFLRTTEIIKLLIAEPPSQPQFHLKTVIHCEEPCVWEIRLH